MMTLRGDRPYLPSAAGLTYAQQRSICPGSLTFGRGCSLDEAEVTVVGEDDLPEMPKGQSIEPAVREALIHYEDLACRCFGVTADQLRSPCRIMAMVSARKMFSLLARHVPLEPVGYRHRPIPYTRIGRALNRDHTSVMHLKKCAEIYLKGSRALPVVRQFQDETAFALQALEGMGYRRAVGTDQWNLPTSLRAFPVQGSGAKGLVFVETL